MKLIRTRNALSAVALIILASAGMSAHATEQEAVIRVAMTAGDIPDYTGAPDQGHEGFRFTGFTLYDPLVRYDLSSSDKAADIVPGLATGWEIDPDDHTRWIFHLREGVKFHDGCDWNADAAVWNFARTTEPEAPQYAPRHVGIIGTYTSEVASVEKVDDYTIAINTRTANSLFPYDMAMFLMISPCAVEAAGNDYTVYREDPAGTGPYRFDRVVPHERLELVRNDDYWDQDRIPKHDRMVLLPMPEASTRAAALLSGQVDIVEAPSPDTIGRLKSAGMQVITVPYPHNWDYLLNLNYPPFDDIRVRQAANHAVKRQDIVDMLQGIAMPAYQSLIETQPWAGDPTKYKYDPEKARALLEEAGCLPCKIKVGISTSGSGQMQPLPMNELVKEQLDAAGFEVELVPMDWNALLGVAFAGSANTDFNALNISLAPIDAVQGVIKHFMSDYLAPNGFNWSYVNEEVDTLGKQALAEFDIERRDALLTRMNEIATNDALEVYIVHDLNPRALSPKLSGFVQAQSWFQDWTPIVVNP